MREVLRQALKVKEIAVNSIDARAKEPDSFGIKAEAKSEVRPSAPKYRNPLVDINDLAGLRVITFFPSAVVNVGDCIQEEFEVLEHIDHKKERVEEKQFGYLSKHYLVRLKGNRTTLPEYNAHLDLIAEIQARTILQHAWAEIEHDIQYKSSDTTPESITRRFMALASLLEIADREFQAIQKEDKLLKERARTSVEQGQFDQVEITADALRTYLDKQIGADARTTDFSYEYTARLVRRLGFTTIEQIDECIKRYDDDQLSRIRWGRRQGQLSRFEDMLLAGMGCAYLKRLPDDAEWRNFLANSLNIFREHRIPIGDYDPKAELGGESAD